MRCLYIAHRAPFPPAGGAKVRAFHCIRHLHEAGYDVTVASLVRNDMEAGEIEGLAGHCTQMVIERTHESIQTLRMVGNLLTSSPSTMGYFHSPALHRRLREIHTRQPFDLVICHSSSVAPYALPLQGAKKILDFVDMDSEKWRLYARIKRFPMTVGYRIEGTKLRRAEAALARQFDLSIVVTKGELEILQRIAPEANATFVPNGVSLEDFQPSEAPYSDRVVSFIGRFDYFPNEQAAVWFCDHVLPDLSRRLPGMVLQLVGANPSKAVRSLMNRQNVVVTGTVESITPFATHSLATVAPLQLARGVQNKVLESMAMGIPALVSEEVAKGVDAQDGEDFLVCSTPADYVAALERLATDPDARHQLASRGRKAALERFSWPTAMRSLDQAIDSL